MQTSELKSSLVYSTSETQRWISKGFIIGLPTHANMHMLSSHAHLSAAQPSEPQPIEGSLHQLFRMKIAQDVITWLIRTSVYSVCSRQVYLATTPNSGDVASRSIANTPYRACATHQPLAGESGQQKSRDFSRDTGTLQYLKKAIF